MTIEQFINLSYRQLEKLTKVDKSNWSKYFNKKLSPSWKSINEVSKSLNMSPSDLMLAIQIKREIMLKKSIAWLI